MKKVKKSLLAQSLSDLMSSFGLSQKEWADVLHVTPAAVSQWLNDKTLPKAKYIWGIVTLVSQTKKFKKAVDAFYKMAELPIEKVTPHHKGARKSIGHYVSLDLYEGVHSRISGKVFASTLKINQQNQQKIAEFLNTLD